MVGSPDFMAAYTAAMAEARHPIGALGAIHRT
jgi:hypothetical protein